MHLKRPEDSPVLVDWCNPPNRQTLVANKFPDHSVESDQVGESMIRVDQPRDEFTGRVHGRLGHVGWSGDVGSDHPDVNQPIRSGPTHVSDEAESTPEEDGPATIVNEVEGEIPSLPGCLVNPEIVLHQPSGDYRIPVPGP